MFLVNQLNGFNASSAAPSFTFVASGGGTATTVTIPGTPTAGDICVIWTWGRNSLSTGPGAGPSGFTEVVYDNTSGGGSIHVKILTGSETTVTTYAGTNATRWIAATFHPSIPITGFTYAGGNSEATVGDPVSQNIAASAVSAPVILIGQMGSSGAVARTAPGMTELNNHASTSHYSHYRIYNPGSSPADNTYDMTDAGSQNVLQSGYLTFTY